MRVWGTEWKVTFLPQRRMDKLSCGPRSKKDGNGPIRGVTDTQNHEIFLSDKLRTDGLFSTLYVCIHEGIHAACPTLRHDRVVEAATAAALLAKKVIRPNSRV